MQKVKVELWIDRNELIAMGDQLDCTWSPFRESINMKQLIKKDPKHYRAILSDLIIQIADQVRGI